MHVHTWRGGVQRFMPRRNWSRKHRMFMATATAFWTTLPVCWAIAQSPDSAASLRLPESVSSVSGQVRTLSGRKLPEMIVYLESADPQHHFAPPPNPAVITQKGARFSPSLLVVAVGQTVEFINDEDRPIEHNVFSRAPVKSFDLGLYRPGVGKSVTFDKAGVVPLYCSIHRYMDGVIFVSPTPMFAHVEKNGRYTIADVPPGDYHVKTWQRSRRFVEKSRRITVETGQLLTIHFEMSRK